MAKYAFGTDIAGVQPLNVTDRGWLQRAIDLRGERKHDANTAASPTKLIYPTVDPLSTTPAYRTDGTQLGVSEQLRQYGAMRTYDDLDSTMAVVKRLLEGRGQPPQPVAGFYTEINLYAIIDQAEATEHEYMMLGTQKSTTDIITRSYPTAARRLLNYCKAIVAHVLREPPDQDTGAREPTDELGVDIGETEASANENKTGEEPWPPNAPRPTMTTGTDHGKPQRTVGTATQAGQDNRGALKPQRTIEAAEQAGQDSRGALTPPTVVATTADEGGSFENTPTPAALRAFRDTKCGARFTEENIRNSMDGLSAHDQEAMICEWVAEAMLYSSSIDPREIPELGEVDGKDKFDTALDIVMSALIDIQEEDHLAARDYTHAWEPGEQLIRRIEALKYSDPIRMIGGGVQVQAAYDSVAYLLNFALKDKTTTFINEALRSFQEITPAEGSAWGRTFGICEYGRDFATTIALNFKSSIIDTSAPTFIELTKHAVTTHDKSMASRLAQERSMSMAQSRINERIRSKGVRTHEDRNRGKATKPRQPTTHYEPAALLSGDQVTDDSEDREYTRTFEQTMLERMDEMREIIDTFAAIKDTSNKRGTNEESNIKKVKERYKHAKTRKYTRPHALTKHGPIKSGRCIINDQAAIINDLTIGLKEAHEMMNKQAELIKEMNIKINNQSNDLGIY